MRSEHIVGPLCISPDDAAGAAPQWIQFVATEESGSISYVVEEAVSPTERKSGERSYRALKFQSKDLGTTILHWAAARGHGEVVNALLKGGANVNAKDNRGRTALHWAAREGHVEVVHLVQV